MSRAGAREESQPALCGRSSLEQRRVRGTGPEEAGSPNPAPLLDLREIQGGGFS